MTLTIEKKEVTGKVVTKTNVSGSKEVVTEEEVLKPIVTETPMANVGLKVGATKNLGNYESLRIDISLHIPCVPEEEDINDAFDLASTWCDKKMEEVWAEIKPELENK